MYSVLRQTLFLASILIVAAFSATTTNAQSVTNNQMTDSTKSAMPKRDAEADYPDPNEFMPDVTEPSFDYGELRTRIRYPEEARLKNIEGKVVVRVLVDTAGRPVKMMIDYSDNELLTEAAKAAIMGTKFIPGMRRGKPVYVWVSIPVVFQLR